MKLNVTKKIGRNNFHFQFDGDNLFKVILESQKLSFDAVEKCGICDKDNLFLDAYITKEKKYEYCAIKCKDCGACLTFGRQQQDANTFYLRRIDGVLDWKKYEREE